MGNRTMKTPNRRGRTVARQLIPKAVRRRLKRAKRKAVKAQGHLRRVKPSKQERVLPKSAKVLKITKLARPSQKRTGKVSSQLQKRVSTKKPYQKRKPRRVARSQKAAKPAKQSQQKATQNVAIILLRKPAQEPQQKRPLELPAHAQSLLPTNPKQPEREPATQEAEREPLDYLRDGVVEWGIKHEEDAD